MSPREMQAVQALGAVCMAVFVGQRFLPVRWRGLAGRAVAGVYLTGFAIFVVYTLIR